MQMVYQNNNNWSFGGRRGKDAVYEMVRRTFNSIASQVGTNPLINDLRNRMLNGISDSRGEEYKYALIYGGTVVEPLRKLRSLL